MIISKHNPYFNGLTSLSLGKHVKNFQQRQNTWKLNLNFKALYLRGNLLKQAKGHFDGSEKSHELQIDI